MAASIHILLILSIDVSLSALLHTQLVVLALCLN